MLARGWMRAQRCLRVVVPCFFGLCIGCRTSCTTDPNEVVPLAEKGPEIWFIDGNRYDVRRTYFARHARTSEFVVEVACSTSDVLSNGPCGGPKTMSAIFAAVVERKSYQREAVVGGDPNQLSVRVVVLGRAGLQETTSREVRDLEANGERTWGDDGEEFRVKHTGWYMDFTSGDLYYVLEWSADPKTCQEVVSGNLSDGRAGELVNPLLRYIVVHRLHLVPKDDSGVPESYRFRDTSQIGVAISCKSDGQAAISYRVSRRVDQVADRPEIRH
jgi:hypothetical protein